MIEFASILWHKLITVRLKISMIVKCAYTVIINDERWYVVMNDDIKWWQCVCIIIMMKITPTTEWFDRVTSWWEDVYDSGSWW